MGTQSSHATVDAPRTLAKRYNEHDYVFLWLFILLLFCMIIDPRSNVSSNTLTIPTNLFFLISYEYFLNIKLI